MASPLLNIRMPARHRHVYMALAAATGQTFSDFVREAMTKEAARRIAFDITDQDTAEQVRRLLEEALPA